MGLLENPGLSPITQQPFQNIFYLFIIAIERDAQQGGVVRLTQNQATEVIRPNMMSA